MRPEGQRTPRFLGTGRRRGRAEVGITVRFLIMENHSGKPAAVFGTERGSVAAISFTAYLPAFQTALGVPRRVARHREVGPLGVKVHGQRPTR